MKAAPVLAIIFALGLMWAGWESRTARVESTALRAELERSRASAARVADSAATTTARSSGPKAELSSGRASAASSHKPSAPAQSSALKPEILPDGTIRLADGSLLTPAELEALAVASRKAVTEAKNKGPDGASYSAGKATGPPETNPGGGDSTRAWCPAPQNGQGEWLQLRYAHPTEISEINIHETYATGALSKVTALLPDGTEKVLWEGTEPREPPPVERVIKVPRGIRSDQIRLTLDTSRTGDWQEIDAVELVGKDGSHQWASEATASSHWGSGSADVGGWDYGVHHSAGEG